MAIHAAEAVLQSAQPIDIEAWTEQVTAAMGVMTIATPGDMVQGSAATSFQIPLDDNATLAAAVRSSPAATAKQAGAHKQKELPRRDDSKRREALSKGGEGTKRRMRWEKDRLLNNPYVEPPEPRDWEVHPTHPVHNVPYYLAPLWDAGLSRQNAERRAAAKAAAAATRNVAKKPTTPGVVPKELREKLKRCRGAKGLLMDLEAEVRKFVEEWEDQERRAEAEGLPADPDSSDDEIVFVGRHGQMSDAPSKTFHPHVKREMVLFETPEEDHSGSFGRWLVHRIGVYYGLKTWSVSVGNPARRVAYVGVKGSKPRTERKVVCGSMPRPLWGLV